MIITFINKILSFIFLVINRSDMFKVYDLICTLAIRLICTSLRLNKGWDYGSFTERKPLFISWVLNVNKYFLHKAKLNATHLILIRLFGKRLLKFLVKNQANAFVISLEIKCLIFWCFLCYNINNLLKCELKS